MAVDSISGVSDQGLIITVARGLVVSDDISRIGLIGQPGELVDMRMIDVPSALRVAKAHADVIVGIKVRCSDKIGEMASLKPGSTSDVAVFDLVQGNFSPVDSQGEVRKATQKLVSVLALRQGSLP